MEILLNLLTAVVCFTLGGVISGGVKIPRKEGKVAEQNSDQTPPNEMEKDISTLLAYTLKKEGR